MTAIIAGMGRLFQLAVLIAWAGPVAAQVAEPDLRGVGIVVQAGNGECTGTLIEPDLVLTAGHCLTGRGEDFNYHAAKKYTFSPSTASGNTGARFLAKSVAVHPIYLILPNGTQAKRRRDVGLIRLSARVPAAMATPIAIAPADIMPGRGFVLSFRGPDGGRLRQRACPVISEENQFLVFGCEVVGGDSGSPFLIVQDGIASVYAGVSSRFFLKEQPVGLATVIGHSFAGLSIALQTGQGR